MTEPRKQPKNARCPDCGGALELYEGANPHKAGTGYCAKDGKRVQLGEGAA